LSLLLITLTRVTARRWSSKITDHPQDDTEVSEALTSDGNRGGHRKAHVGPAVNKAPRNRGKTGAKKGLTDSKPQSTAVDVKHMTPELYAKITNNRDDDDAVYYAHLPTGGDCGEQPEAEAGSATTKVPSKQDNRGDQKHVMGAQHSSDTFGVEHMTAELYHQIT
jgi:hypothetical protein